jgi:hypothetical protein
MDEELKRRLEKTLDDLSALCDRLDERIVGCRRKEEVAAVFVDELFRRFRKFLNNVSAGISRSLKDPAITEDDVLQDIIEYMLRWNLDEVVFRSTGESIWLPNMKRSVSNCYVNLKAKRTRQMRRGIRKDLEDVHSELLLDEQTEGVVQLVSDIKKRLTPVQNKIFKFLLDPDVKCGHVTNAKQMAELIGVRPTCFNNNYAKIRTITKTVCEDNLTQR